MGQASQSLTHRADRRREPFHHLWSVGICGNALWMCKVFREYSTCHEPRISLLEKSSFVELPLSTLSLSLLISKSNVVAAACSVGSMTITAIFPMILQPTTPSGNSSGHRDPWMFSAGFGNLTPANGSRNSRSPTCTTRLSNSTLAKARKDMNDRITGIIALNFSAEEKALYHSAAEKEALERQLPAGHGWVKVTCKGKGRGKGNVRGGGGLNN
jgi:hypothetical protein